MASESGSLLAFIRRIAASRSHSDLTDGELLHRFAVQREASAFSTLMHRHGPMVLGVCQSILQDAHDAEDAFQATFLVLVRKPKTIGKPASVASWLHGVAYRLAMKARGEAARRRACERQAVTMPSCQPQEEVIWRDLRPVLHQEVDRLPDRYRLPFVLCYLEGKTNEEAAHLLGWPKGTVLSSLSRARERLRRRLTRRGLALASGLLAAMPSPTAALADVPAALAENTFQAALLYTTGSGAVGGIGAPVLAYAEGMLHATFVAKVKRTAVILLALTAGGFGAGVGYRVRQGGHEGIASVKPPPPESLPREKPPRATQVSHRPAGERGKLQGTWRVAGAQRYGRAIDVLKDRRLVIAGDRFTLSGGRGEVSGIIRSAPMEGKFTLGRNNPAGIDLMESSALLGNWHLHGIYSLDGKSLKIRLRNANDDERPGPFVTKPDSGQLLLSLERE
jgi:RNA polymerase sigma factor (sigma-70 family)